ncbi:hypothetical protein R1sor_007483 [Riccia sorocarpa]|uniref:Reverse transcriptase domain-containing protein n=1 Tax=Riccia sorocarpa TaxID=122646 RepID=A0ABD3HTH7_9MARC
MPGALGARCIFTEEEVARALAQLHSGKAEDLEGFTIELLRWSGLLLLSMVTRLLNHACSHGFPEAWNCRRVVPLHKTGPKDEPALPFLAFLIDDLYWLCKNAGIGVEWGGNALPLLLFADDVAMLANSADQLRELIGKLESFCHVSGTKVNLKKTRWLRIGGRSEERFIFQGQLIDECKTYKYLGIDFSANLSWADCWKARVACGFRALFSLGAKCRRADLIDWTLRIRLFDTLVKTAVMYGIPVWGPTISKTGWKNIESIQKVFLQSELGVRPQVPYVLLLSESGRLPLEAEALFTMIRYAQHLRLQDETRFSSLAWSESRARGWQADVRRWADRWGIPEDLWNLTGTSLRSAFSALVVEHLWSDSSCRQKYYLRDVTRLDPYKEQTYLRAGLPVRVRKLIAKYRVSSHTLRVEEGRWQNLARDRRILSSTQFR